MRKIETQMNQAIRNGHAWSKDNTCVTYDPTNNMSAEVFLHGNHIATVTDNDLTLYSGGGWFTNTTKSRLNALIQEFSFKGSNIFQKNFNWYVRAFNTVTPFHDGIVITSSLRRILKMSCLQNEIATREHIRGSARKHSLILMSRNNKIAKQRFDDLQ